MIPKNCNDLALSSVSDYKKYTEKKHVIKQKSQLLKEIFDIQKTDEDIFIDKKGNIYPIAPNISMDNFNLNTDPSVMFGSKTLNNQV